MLHWIKLSHYIRIQEKKGEKQREIEKKIRLRTYVAKL